LTVPPQQLHQRSPLFIGSKKMVEELEALVEEEARTKNLSSDYLVVG
jgi:fructose-1,6-bisphosphatase